MSFYNVGVCVSVCVCGNPVPKDFECKVTFYLSTMQQSDQLIAKRKQRAGSLFRDASQRS